MLLLFVPNKSFGVCFKIICVVLFWTTSCHVLRNKRQMRLPTWWGDGRKWSQLILCWNLEVAERSWPTKKRKAKQNAECWACFVYSLKVGDHLVNILFAHVPFVKVTLFTRRNKSSTALFALLSWFFWGLVAAQPIGMPCRLADVSSGKI